MAICEIRHWLGHGKWNGLCQVIVGLSVITVCAVAVAYDMRIFPRLLCGGIFFLAGVWTLTIDEDFRPCWRALGCIYTPCCGDKRDGKCRQCWLGMQVFAGATAVCVLAVSALFMSENPQRSSSAATTPMPEPDAFAGINATLISLCAIQILLAVAAVVVFCPCIRPWYLQTKDEENYFSPAEIAGHEFYISGRSGSLSTPQSPTSETTSQMATFTQYDITADQMTCVVQNTGLSGNPAQGI